MKMFLRYVKNIAWLCRPFWQYGKIYILLSVGVLGLYSAVDDAIYVRFPEIMIDLLSAGESFSSIGAAAAVICGIFLLNRIVHHISRAYFTRKQVEIGLRVNRDIYQKAMGLDYKYIDSPRYYDNYAWAMREYAEQVKQGREVIVSFSQCVLSLAALSAIVAPLGPWILLLEAVQTALCAMINRRVNENGIKEKDAVVSLNRRLDYFHRLFYMKDYAADMKSTPLSRSVFQEYSKIGKRKVSVVGFFAKKTELLYSVQELIGSLTELIIILYLVQSIVSGRIPEVGMYMTLLLAYYRLDCKIYTLSGLMKEAGSLSMNAEKIRAFFELQSEIETERTHVGAAPSGGNFSVGLRNAGFSYENSAFFLSGLNLFIHPGEKVAIVGENGAGKSTFVKLLLRLYDVEEGEIRINGTPIREYDIHALRQRIGVAFQDTNIYAMSLEKNISLYGEVPEAVLRRAAEAIGLDAILEKNHTGYHAELTREFHEDGIILSGGEAQKVALARVMAGDFGLLLLDEPSSALDPIAEYRMTQAILSTANKATTIIVAHRLSAVRDADRIVVLDQGKIRECGNHDELMALHGKYYEMFTKQAENYVKG